MNDSNQIQNAKLSFNWENEDNAALYVYNVTFNTPVNINDLKGANLSDVTASYTQEYAFSYDNSIQGTRSELVNAILDKAITDGFDYQNAEIMFKENSPSTDAELGTVRRFIVVVKNTDGIREISAHISTASDDNTLISNINNNRIKTYFADMTTYSNNILAKYDLADAAEMCSELSN